MSLEHDIQCMILSDKTLNEILDKIDNSITELARGALESPEFQNNYKEIENFLANQYEIRLQNILESKNTSIHHLESGMKNKIIQRKLKLFEDIFKLFQN